jgi:DNA-binding ferritin-like protein
MHTLHLNVYGDDFDNMHKEVLKKYYEECDNDYDDAAEWGRCYGGPAPNKNESAPRVQFKSIPAKPYTRAEAISIADSNLSALLEQMHTLFRVADSKSDDDPIATGIANWLQTRIEYWSKEIFFFNKNRMEAM